MLFGDLGNCLSHTMNPNGNTEFCGTGERRMEERMQELNAASGATLGIS